MTAADLRTGSRFKRSPDGKVLDVVSVKEHDADKRFEGKGSRHAAIPDQDDGSVQAMSDGAVHRAATRLYRIMGRATAHDSLDDLPDQVRESYLRDAEKLLGIRCPHCGEAIVGETLSETDE